MTSSTPFYREINYESRVRDLYAHPVGRDVIDKLLAETNKPAFLVNNVLIRNLRIGTLAKWLKKPLPHSFWEQLFWLLNSEKEKPENCQGTARQAWWKDAVFYQIYPRSFCDGNGDGTGDLAGITARLDYLSDLGVDAIWLSPVYDSPNDDMGYDIRDYRAILDIMGTMDDMNRLIAETHKRGMKIIMDLVVNHTSDEHRWFREALRDPEGPYGKYYFFRSGRDASPPNNWVSFFGGSAWRWFPEINAWGLHLFSDKQMDLNWDHEPLRKEIYDMIRWWLVQGVDGFRLDVINYISKRDGLPDGDPVIGELVRFRGIENYYYGPRLHAYLKEMRRETFDTYGAFSVAETPGIGLEMGKLLSGEERGEFDLVFNFDHLETPGHARYDIYRYNLNALKAYYINYQTRLADNHWMSLFLENHDNPRMISKVNNDPQFRKPLAKLLLTLLLTMRGTPFLFQGEELGAVNSHFKSIDSLRDVEVIHYFAEMKEKIGEQKAWERCLAGTRDHARVPMVWDADLPLGGFSIPTPKQNPAPTPDAHRTSEHMMRPDTGQKPSPENSGEVKVKAPIPWIEGDAPETGWSAREQKEDPSSVLSWSRALLALRKNAEPLRRGSIHFVRPKKKNYFAYFRGADAEENPENENAQDAEKCVNALPGAEAGADTRNGAAECADALPETGAGAAAVQAAEMETGAAPGEENAAGNAGSEMNRAAPVASGRVLPPPDTAREDLPLTDPEIPSGCRRVFVEFNLSDRELRRKIDLKPGSFRQAWSSYDERLGVAGNTEIRASLRPYEAVIYLF